MNNKNKFIAFFIFILILVIYIFNINNPEKTKFYLFTSKTEQLSIGNLITLTFISGFTFSSLLTVFATNNLQESFDDNYINEEDIDKSEDKTNQNFKVDRPPERDVRESHPTISVNYRFVDQDDDSNNSKKKNSRKNNLNIEDNDWLNNNDSW
tara:strand:+ start:229 stop:687 length:459 start_codon:yes stop_codon:yes gene_type:complete